MSLSAFNDASRQPQDADLATVLGETFRLWNQLKADIAKQFAPITAEWGCSSGKTGWGLRLKQKDRVVLYMVPCRGYFFASFALGEKAVKAAHEASLPATVLAVIDAAPKYAEGRGVRFVVRTPNDVDNVVAIAKIKLLK